MSSYSDYANAVSAIITQGGAQQAELQRQKGQIWGQTFQNLGQIAMNLPMQLAQQKTVQQDQQIKALQLSAYQRAQAGQQQANQVIAALPRRDDGTYDTGALLQKLSASNVPLEEQEKLAKSIDGVNGVIGSWNTSKRDHAADLAHSILSSAHGQPLTADAVHLGVAAAKAMGLATEADEAKMTDALASGVDPTQALETMRGLSEKYKDVGKPVILPRPGAQLVSPTGQPLATAPQLDNERPVTVAPGGSLVNPKSGSVLFTAPESAAQLQQEADRQAELAIRRGQLGVAQQREKREGALASGTTLPGIKPDSAQYRTAQDLAYGKLTFADFQRLYPSRSAAQAPMKQAIYDQARTLNPNFNPAAFEMGFNLAKQPKVQQQLASLDNVIQAAPDLIRVSNDAARSNIPLLNKVINPAGYAIGSRKFSNLRTAQIAFADELSGALGYGSATDMSREMGFNMTDPNLSPANFAAALNDVVLPFVQRKRATMLNQMGVYGAPGMNPAASAPAPGASAIEQWERGPDGKLRKVGAK